MPGPESSTSDTEMESLSSQGQEGTSVFVSSSTTTITVLINRKPVFTQRPLVVHQKNLPMERVDEADKFITVREMNDPDLDPSMVEKIQCIPKPSPTTLEPESKPKLELLDEADNKIVECKTDGPNLDPTLGVKTHCIPDTAPTTLEPESKPKLELLDEVDNKINEYDIDNPDLDLNPEPDEEINSISEPATITPHIKPDLEVLDKTDKIIVECKTDDSDLDPILGEKVNLISKPAQDVPQKKLKLDVPDETDNMKVEWKIEDPDLDPNLDEKIVWIPNPKDPKLHRCYGLELDKLLELRTLGPKSAEKDIKMNKFISKTILSQLEEARAKVTGLWDIQLQGARSRSNPFETLDKNIFINRAALKLANIDYLLNFQLSTPQGQGGHNIHMVNPLYFSDVCAGPGGFSEYIFWRRFNASLLTRGFGFTLKEGPNDFKVEEFLHGTECFDTIYGPLGTGDVLCPENVKAYIDFVYEQTQENGRGGGVHLMTADGGIEMEKGTEEILSGPLYLAQMMIGVGVVKPRGHLVIKLFDTLTPFSVGLIYLMTLCFENVAIHKPRASRPANSERYLICLNKRDPKITHPIFKYLENCHQLLATKTEPEKNQTILELVPHEFITSNISFIEYIRTSNRDMSINQIKALLKMSAYYDFAPLNERDLQKECESVCLNRWKLPMVVFDREEINDEDVEKAVLNGPGRAFRASLRNQPKPLDYEVFQENLNSPFDWLACFIGKKGPKFYYAPGTSKRTLWGYECDRFEELPGDGLQVPKDTLIYGEFITETIPDHSRTQVTVLHIMDAFRLGGRDVGGLPFNIRWYEASVFFKCLNRTRNTVMIRMQKFYHVEKMKQALEELMPCQVGRICRVGTHGSFYNTNRMMFLKTVKEPFMKRSGSEHLEKEAYADFWTTLGTRLIWNWTPFTWMSDPINAPEDALTTSKLISMIEEKIAKLQKDPPSDHEEEMKKYVST